MWEPFLKPLLGVCNCCIGKPSLAAEARVRRGPCRIPAVDTDRGNLRVWPIHLLRLPQQAVRSQALELVSSDSKRGAFPTRFSCFDSKNKIIIVIQIYATGRALHQ